MSAIAITTLPLWVPMGYWIGLLLSIVLAGFSWFRWRAKPSMKVPLQAKDALLLMLLIGFGVVELAQGLVHAELRQALPLASAAWLAALNFLIVRAAAPRPQAWWFGLAMSGIGLGAWAAWQTLFNGLTRATGHPPLHSILFGNLALLSALLCLAGLGWAWQQKVARTYWGLLLVAGALGGGMASALSGTRGGWLVVPLALGVFYYGYAYCWRAGWRWLVMCAVVAVMLVVYVVPQSGVAKRVDKAVNEVHRYMEGTGFGSVGARLEMYRGGLWLIRERPFRGYGHEGYEPAMQALKEREVIHPELGSYWHAHNDLIDAWVRRGVPGLMVLLALYLLPLWRFLPGLRSQDVNIKTFSIAGVLLTISFVSFGLSYSFFAYPVGVVVYTSWLAFIWVQHPGKSQQVSNHV